MNKLALTVLMGAAVFALSQCKLISTTVEYSLSGFSDELDVMYQDKSGELVQVTGTNPSWSTSFGLSSSDTPFLAFIRVANIDPGSVGVDVSILADGVTVAGPSTAIGGGGSTEIYGVIY